MGRSKSDAGLLKMAFGAWRGRPQVWLSLSLAAFPLMFFRMAVSGGTYLSGGAHVLVWLSGEIVIFTLVFLFWSRAALFYYFDTSIPSGRIDGLWRRSIVEDKEYFIRLSLRFWLFQMLYMAVVVIPIVVAMVIMLVVTDAKNIGDIAYEPWFFLLIFAIYAIASLLIVRICMIPQIAMLRESIYGRQAKATMKESVMMVKSNYRRVLSFFMLPWLLGYAVYFLLGQLYWGYKGNLYISIILIVALSCVEGGRISFIAAGFSELYKQAGSSRSSQEKEGLLASE